MSKYNGVAQRTFILPQSKYGVKATYPMKPKGVTLHNTYNDASAENEIKYMQSNNNAVSYHGAIDDKEVVWGVPLDRSSWHAGDGKNGYGNRNHISFEICYSKSGGAKYKKAEAHAVKVVAYTLYKYGWGMSKLKKHQDWSGKNCPHRILDEKRWNEVYKKIEKELNRLNGSTQQSSKPKPSKPSKPAQNKPQSNDIAEDGWFGPATARKAQQVYGLKIVDGIVSGQPKNSSTRNIPSARYGSTGSNLIKAMAKEFGVPVRFRDGKITVPSMLIEAMQKHYGTPVDKKLSGPSMVIKEWQKALNKGNRK